MSGGPVPYPFLVTERLELWLPVAADLAAIVAMMTPDEMRLHLGPSAPSASDQFARLLRFAGGWSLYGYSNFMVRYRGERELVGTCGLFHTWRGFGKGLDDAVEAGWIIGNAHWGKGLASEAMQAILAWFEATHGAQRVACMIEKGNVASERLAAKLGFVRYDEHTMAEDGAELNLYERLPG